MKTRGMQVWFALLIMVALTTGTIWPVAARGNQPEAAGQSVMLRLKYATFDPLQGEPPMPPALPQRISETLSDSAVLQTSRYLSSHSHLSS